LENSPDDIERCRSLCFASFESATHCDLLYAAGCRPGLLHRYAAIYRRQHPFGPRVWLLRLVRRWPKCGSSGFKGPELTRREEHGFQCCRFHVQQFHEPEDHERGTLAGKRFRACKGRRGHQKTPSPPPPPPHPPPRPPPRSYIPLLHGWKMLTPPVGLRDIPSGNLSFGKAIGSSQPGDDSFNQAIASFFGLPSIGEIKRRSSHPL